VTRRNKRKPCRCEVANVVLGVLNVALTALRLWCPIV
jgi:hypothetical protein